MNTQSNAAHQSGLQPQRFTNAVVAALRPFYWSIRRELWESRWIYLAPTAAAILFLAGSAIGTVRMRLHMERPASFGIDVVMAGNTHLADPYELAPALIMGTGLIVGIFYCLDALYGERRDRSILFWKSLPVSDVTAVIAKFVVPILILPLLTFIITVGAQLLMLVISSAIFVGSGANIGELWTQVLLFRVPAIWLYHLLTVHGLWYAPLYAWLLLVSAWAPRAPFLWAFLPPFVVWGVEKITFNTSYFLNTLQYRLTGPGGEMSSNDHSHDYASTLIPHHFLSVPGLWTGLALAAMFLYATVQLRRSRGPI